MGSVQGRRREITRRRRLRPAAEMRLPMDCAPRADQRAGARRLTISSRENYGAAGLAAAAGLDASAGLAAALAASDAAVDAAAEAAASGADGADSSDLLQAETAAPMNIVTSARSRTLRIASSLEFLTQP